MTQTIRVETWIAATPERCFDAARDLDLHAKLAAHTGERAVGGRLTGLIEANEEVTWQARHFGVVQRFTSRITKFDRPHSFQDAMVRGAFRAFVHDHTFAPENGGTRMTDTLVFEAPFGILGRIVERLVLRRYLERFLVERAAGIRGFVQAPSPVPTNTSSAPG